MNKACNALITFGFLTLLLAPSFSTAGFHIIGG